MTSSPIQGVADTARWVAMYRAIESERPDALFRDPFARRLAGARGEQIHASLPPRMRNASWSVVTRTVQFDRHVMQQVAAGTTVVVNLAAGLDTRPYRLPLPSTLTWVEVDQPALLAEKSALLSDATPSCILKRIPADLSQPESRRELFQQLSLLGERILILTEGLIMYLDPEAVAGLARDLRGHPTFQAWVTDIISPALLRMIDKDWGGTLREGGAPMRFAAQNGPAWFDAVGWHAVHSEGTFRLAGDLHRLPMIMHLFSRLPGSERYHPKRPWAGTCLLVPA